MNFHGKPCLGYPSRAAAIRALGQAGHTPKKIAKRVGCSLQTVYTTRWRHEIKESERRVEEAMKRIERKEGK